MLEFVLDLLEKEKVTLAAPIELSDCKINRQYLLDRAEISDGTAIMLAIPYLSRNFSKKQDLPTRAYLRISYGIPPQR